MTKIHSTAIVDSQAEIDSSVAVGPYSVIGRVLERIVLLKAIPVLEKITRLGILSH